MSDHLHDELPPPGHAPLRYECVDRLLLLLGLLDLDQPRDGVDGRTLLKGKGVNVNDTSPYIFLPPAPPPPPPRPLTQG